jgi:hypothetical protein
MLNLLSGLEVLLRCKLACSKRAATLAELASQRYQSTATVGVQHSYIASTT